MSWKEQIYNHEIQPPEAAWAYIAQALEEECPDLKRLMLNASAQPEIDVWNNIALRLDDQKVANRFLEIEIAAPENLWKEINEQLELHELQQKFTDHVAPPPETTWQVIQERLIEEAVAQKFKDAEVAPPTHIKKALFNSLQSGRVVPIKKWLTVAAAAVVTGLMFIAVNQWLQPISNAEPGIAIHRNEKDTVAGYPSAIEEVDGKDPQLSNPSTKQKKPLLAIKHAANHSSSPSAPTIVSQPSLSVVKANEEAFTNKIQLEKLAEKQIKNLDGEIKQDVSLLDLPNSYFFITGPNGESVRVSAKFKNTIKYMNGNEEMLDVILRESQYWKNLFQNWKEKVGSSPLAPSAENFMDISSFVHFLAEHQQNPSK